MARGDSPAVRCLRASGKNDDTRKLQKILASCLLEERQGIVNAKDKSGKSCLIIAVISNHLEIARLLLQNGANVHYMNPSATKAGSALHEAAARKNDKMAELLLQGGANPFTENARGETAIELAVLADAPKVVRCCEERALFAGEVDMQIANTGLLCRSHEYRSRHIVVMDILSYPSEGKPAVVRRQLWVHSDRRTIMPSCRIWLDGAAAFGTGLAGREAVLRLRPQYTPSVAGLFTRREPCVCLFLRSPASENMDPISIQERWLKLLRSCYLNEHVVLRLESLHDTFLKSGAASGSDMPPGNHLPAWQHQQQVLPLPAIAMQPPVMPAVAVAAHQLLSAQSARNATSAPQAAPPDVRRVHSDAGYVSALHGETDEEFAARLAVAISDSGPPNSFWHSPANPDLPLLVPPQPSEPSAPTLILAGPLMPAASERPDGDLCVACYERPKQVGFLHGTTVHHCMCTGCARMMVGKPCPICRKPVDALLEVFS